LIVTPLMIVTVVPRVLTLSVFFATCFPLFSNYGSDGFRSGLILFICTFIFYAVTFAIVSYVTIIKPFQAKKREAVDIWMLASSGFSALISPCLIVDQTCGTFLWASCLSAMNHFILLTGLGLTLILKPSMWNLTLTNSENFGSSKDLYIQLVYLLRPWLVLSMFASLFLEKFGSVFFRTEIGKKLGTSLCYGKDGFLKACKDGHVALVESMLKFSNSSVLNQTEPDVPNAPYDQKTGLHLACDCNKLVEVNNNGNKLEVVKLLVKEPKINMNVKDINGASALFYCIGNEPVARVLLESGKLDIQKMDRFRVPEFVQNEEDGSIEFVYRGYLPNDFYRVKMNSPKSLLSIEKIEGFYSPYQEVAAEL